jgi:hypothetical protein
LFFEECFAWVRSASSVRGIIDRLLINARTLEALRTQGPRTLEALRSQGPRTLEALRTRFFF